MAHVNAALTPIGRLRLAKLMVDHGWTIARAAERFQVSGATAWRWARRYRDGESMQDRSSRPKRHPRRTARRRERRIINLRVTRRWGPHRIAYHLGIARSTVSGVLARYKMPRLRDLDQATGIPIRRVKAKRYEVEQPGDLVHIDIKKLGKIPDGGGWRTRGHGSPQDRAARRAQRRAAHAGASPARGYDYYHHAVDDYTRIAYSEPLSDERKETAAAFYERARAFFAGLGITVRAVMTDNGACYRSKTFAAALGGDVKHRRTKPYRPQTNGKVERFNRTLNTEWAYARHFESNAERADSYADWLHHYNLHRPHTGIGGKTPAERIHNLTGKYS